MMHVYTLLKNLISYEDYVALFMLFGESIANGKSYGVHTLPLNNM